MLTDAEFAEIEARAKAQPDLVVRGAGEEEYYAYFVELGLADTFDPTPPLLVSAWPSPDTTEQAEQEKAHNTAAFHIAAKDTILRLLAELRRLRAELDQAEGEVAGWQSRYESLLEDKVKAYYDLEAANAELRRLRGMKCETCMYWLHGLYPEDYCKLTISKDNKGRDDTLAHAHGASASYAMLCVKPDFGCNQWKVRG